MGPSRLKRGEGRLTVEQRVPEERARRCVVKFLGYGAEQKSGLAASDVNRAEIFEGDVERLRLFQAGEDPR